MIKEEAKILSRSNKQVGLSSSQIRLVIRLEDNVCLCRFYSIFFVRLAHRAVLALRYKEME